MEGTRGVLQTTHQDLQEKEEGRYSMNVSPQEGNRPLRFFKHQQRCIEKEDGHIKS